MVYIGLLPRVRWKGGKPNPKGSEDSTSLYGFICYGLPILILGLSIMIGMFLMMPINPPSFIFIIPMGVILLWFFIMICVAVLLAFVFELEVDVLPPEI